MWRNFGLKSGGTNSEGERGALRSRGDREGEWRISSSDSAGVWESVELSQRGPGVRAPVENGFIVI